MGGNRGDIGKLTATRVRAIKQPGRYRAPGEGGASGRPDGTRDGDVSFAELMSSPCQGREAWRKRGLPIVPRCLA